MRQGALSGREMVGTDVGELDIIDVNSVRAMISTVRPDVVINAAAYTAVDRAETDCEATFAVNRDGPVNIAMVCESIGIPLVHYSTDYVFDGSKQGAYVEDDLMAPLGVYGESKQAGEEAVRNICEKHLIFRTSWVFSAHGNNFVKTMLRLGADREELGVVTDQFGKPTSAAEIARLTLEILASGSGQWGTYHLAQPQVTSWYGFARAIFDGACDQGMDLKIADVKAITTSDYPTPAKRPANSALNCDKLGSVFGVVIRPWRESLSEVIEELKE